MIDIAKEKLLSLPDAAAWLPPHQNGKRYHPATIWRWVVHGCRGVILESTPLGASTYTSVEALQRFADKLQAVRNARRGFRPRTSRQRERARQQADAYLESRGFSKVL